MYRLNHSWRGRGWEHFSLELYDQQRDDLYG